MDTRCPLVGHEEMTSPKFTSKGRKHMRELSDAFLDCLKSGFLAALTEYVRHDNDLNLEIRDAYINIYYKGNSLLNLKETGLASQYKTVIDSKFLTGIEIPTVLTDSTTP